ncbi:MAG: tetratricopeptide repeat protein, partial [Candidatus Cloacimonadota bacterium]|nr:tetratricopeptide repeat protein [Candidatus Cloacimonadota bacterium]
MKKIIVIIVFFILIFSNQLFSQPISELDKILQNQTDEKFDNLQIYINNIIKEKDYIEQMNILEKCIFQLLDLKEFQEAKKYAIIASNLANQKQNFSDLSFFENTTGSINYYLGNFIEVEENYKKALDACYKTQDNFKISKALNNLNTIYTKLGKTDLAIKGFLESIKI